LNRRFIALVPCLLIAGMTAAPGCLRGPAPASPSPRPTPTKSPTPTPDPGTPLDKKTGLVITAIEFNAGNDIVARVKNLSAASVDLVAGKYQICAGEFVYGKLSKAQTTIAAGAEVRMHVNAPSGCTESATEWCTEINSGIVANKGNVAIYKDMNATEFNLDEKIVDFVAWGEGGLPREDVAVKAKIWRTGQFVAVPSGQASISVKVAGNSGKENWQ